MATIGPIAVYMAKTGFRETMWFKLGETKDEQAGEDTPVPLPLEDRYSGGVSAEDTRTFGLHSGTTEYLTVIANEPGTDTVAMKSLVGEMKHSKRRLVAIGASIAAACTMFALYLI